ncbi:hypothetical protein Tco_0097729 [Tanacetum coccineum]
MKDGAIELCDKGGNEFIMNRQRVKSYQSNTENFDKDEDIILDDQGGVTTWMVFGGNTHDLDSFGEETDKTTTLHQILEEVVHTECGDGVASFKRQCQDVLSDNVRDMVTTSKHGRPKESLEDFVSQDLEDHFTCERNSIDLNGATRNTTHLRLLCFSLRNQAINWLDRQPTRSISTWDDLTTRFLE